MIDKLELNTRLEKLIRSMNNIDPHWDTIFIISKVNQFYLTGTMQNGFLTIKRNGAAFFYVYKSYFRAVEEALFEPIISIDSYADAALSFGKNCGNTYFETETVPYGMIERFKRYFVFSTIKPIDKIILELRCVKSKSELEIIRNTGRMHNDFMLNVIPHLFREGMSEAELYAEIYEKIIKHGSEGISRFSSFQAEMLIGQVCFGESSIYPTNMDSPDGSYGMSETAPFGGSRKRKLMPGDLIFVDLAYSTCGYNTDKTQVFIFHSRLQKEVIEKHKICMDILNDVQHKLKPGRDPRSIYNETLERIENMKIENFMGFGKDKVKFIGHGVGLNVDELPIISSRYSKSLEKNMVVSIEPKIGIRGVGMVGVEETFIIDDVSAESVTGIAQNIIEI